jgi:hypothetical protein
VSETRGLRRIFEPKREEVAGGWKRLHNEELHNLYASPDIIIRVIKSRRMRWAANVTRMAEMRNEYIILVGKPVENRRLEKRRHRWEDNIRMDVKEIGWEVVDWIHLAEDRDQWRVVVNTVMNLWVP